MTYLYRSNKNKFVNNIISRLIITAFSAKLQYAVNVKFLESIKTTNKSKNYQRFTIQNLIV